MYQQFIDSKKLAGVNTMVWKDGQVVFQESLGCRNLQTSEPMTIDTIFRIASMTKPITSLLAMMLYEEGKLKLDEPITKWFPQFANMKVFKSETEKYEEANRLISVLDLLTHRAGFTYSGLQKGKLKDDYRRILGGDIDSECTINQWVDGLANLPLVNQPGEIFSYGKSTDLLGIVISTIEGKSLGKVMEEKIFNPLGMTDTFFDVPANKKNRCASNIGFDDLGKLVNLETVPGKMALKERPSHFEFEAGSGGLWSTISDYLQFAKLFVQNGKSNGVPILKKETIELMRTNHLTTFQKENSKLMGSTMFRDHFGFGLGLAVVMKENKYASIPCAGSIGSVGWPGAYGGWWSADPVKESVSIFLTHSMTDPKQLGLGIGFELYEAIDMFANFSREII